MKTSDFFYKLPKHLIAQQPLPIRSHSRLMVIDRAAQTIEHKRFDDIVSAFDAGDCLVMNNSKVLHARIKGFVNLQKAEILLQREWEFNLWEALVLPGKRCKPGQIFCTSEGLTAEFVSILDNGNRLIRFHSSQNVRSLLSQQGEIPLPPYIKERVKESGRYQTIYAKSEGSSAAPTAGLHFDSGLLERIKERNIETAEITLHVGAGTFRPVKTNLITDHIMHQEYYEIDKENAKRMRTCQERKNRIIAVGTTSMRTLEANVKKHGQITEDADSTDIFIYPGISCCVADGLITNFHLPESTLLMLVCAFAGKELIFHAYEEAIKENYRFFSFGDAMLII